MNPLVEKMLIAQREGIDARTLEQIFEHEAKCESKMHLSRCTEHVTHRGTNCLAPEGKNICGDAVQYAQSAIAMGAICADCDNYCSECWTIRPI